MVRVSQRFLGVFLMILLVLSGSSSIALANPADNQMPAVSRDSQGQQGVVPVESIDPSIKNEIKIEDDFQKDVEVALNDGADNKENPDSLSNEPADPVNSHQNEQEKDEVLNASLEEDDVALLAFDEKCSVSSSVDSSLVWDVASASTANGSGIKLWQANGQSNQRFTFELQADGLYIIRIMHSDKVLAVSGLTATRGAKVIQWQDNGTKNMRWRVKGSSWGGYNIISVDSGLVLDFASHSATAGVDLVVWESTGSEKQSFTPGIVKPQEVLLGERSIADGVYSLGVESSSRFVVAVDDSAVGNGASAELQVKSGALGQKFAVSFNPVEGSRGYYTLRALCSGKALAVAGLQASNGADVVQWSDNATPNMRWVIKGNSKSGYMVVSSDTGLCLDFASNGAAEYTNVVVWENTGSPKQKFTFSQEKTLDNGYYAIAPTKRSNLYLSINGGSHQEGSNVVLSAQTGDMAQKYYIESSDDGSYTIKTLHSGKLLGVSSEGKIVQSSVGSAKNQKWVISPDSLGGFSVTSFQGEGPVLSFWTGGNVFEGASLWAQEKPPSGFDQSFVFSAAQLVDDGLYGFDAADKSSLAMSVVSGSLASGQGIGLSERGDSVRQKFIVSNLGDNVVQLTSQLSNKVLCVPFGSSKGAPIVQWDNNGTDNMKWKLVPTYSGSVYIQNISNGLNLDYAADTPASGAPGVVWLAHGGKKQMFAFRKTENPTFKIYIDAGHGWNSSSVGYYDPGAVGLYKENNLSNELASLVANECDRRGIAAVTNAYATSETGVPFRQRQAAAMGLDCTTLVSMHFNSGGGSGVESYIHTYNAAPGSSVLQNIMHENLVAGTMLPDRRKGKMELAVCGGRLPSVLLEIGFIDNYVDTNRYQTSKNRIATFLASGIEKASQNPVCNAYAAKK